MIQISSILSLYLESLKTTPIKAPSQRLTMPKIPTPQEALLLIQHSQDLKSNNIIIKAQALTKQIFMRINPKLILAQEDMVAIIAIN